ncbi:MAG: hypothetical protein ACJA0N_001587 [Pseudohongiellaceae bacterium]|jgi:hypothetical protein
MFAAICCLGLISIISLTMSHKRELSPEDQKRVDKVLTQGVNSVERKPFKPLKLMAILLVVVTSLSVFSLLLARANGL